MDRDEIIELRKKIIKGLELSFANLSKEKKKRNGEFVFMENGKIVHVKARSIKLKP